MVKRLPALRETQVWSWVGKIPWRRKWQSTPALLPGKSHGWRSLIGYSPWGRKESDTTEWLNFHLLFLLLPQSHKFREGTQLPRLLFLVWKWEVWTRCSLNIVCFKSMNLNHCQIFTQQWLKWKESFLISDVATWNWFGYDSTLLTNNMSPTELLDVMWLYHKTYLDQNQIRLALAWWRPEYSKWDCYSRMMSGNNMWPNCLTVGL